MLQFDLPKEYGVRALAERFEVAGLNYWGDDFGPLFERVHAAGKPHNAAFVFRQADGITGVSRRPFMPRGRHVLPTPDVIGRTRAKRYQGGPHDTAAIDLLEFPGGTVLRLAGAPVIVAADGVSVAEDVSSPFAPLMHSYNVNLAERVSEARHIRGRALVVMSDIGDGNYCHWMLDELPRLALLQGRTDVTVVISAAPGPWRRETLGLFGFFGVRVVEVGPHEAVRADVLLVPSCTRDMQHPAHKASRWVLDVLRGSIDLPAVARLPAAGAETRPATRLYVGRGDSPTRKLLNEADLLNTLEPAGFVSVTMGGRSVREQVAMFARAEVIVALHGAALTNIAFCQPGTRLLEIFTPGRDTSAYGMIAGALGMPYAEILADAGGGQDDGLQNCRLDVPEFWRVAEPWLRQSVLP